MRLGVVAQLVIPNSSEAPQPSTEANSQPQELRVKVQSYYKGQGEDRAQVRGRCAAGWGHLKTACLTAHAAVTPGLLWSL